MAYGDSWPFQIALAIKSARSAGKYRNPQLPTRLVTSTHQPDAVGTFGRRQVSESETIKPDSFAPLRTVSVCGRKNHFIKLKFRTVTDDRRITDFSLGLVSSALDAMLRMN